MSVLTPTFTEAPASTRSSSLRRTTVSSGLVALHVLATAIIVPVLARHARS